MTLLELLRFENRWLAEICKDSGHSGNLLKSNLSSSAGVLRWPSASTLSEDSFNLCTLRSHGTGNRIATRCCFNIHLSPFPLCVKWIMLQSFTLFDFDIGTSKHMRQENTAKYATVVSFSKGSVHPLDVGNRIQRRYLSQ